jgi:hypothetical protein
LIVAAVRVTRTDLTFGAASPHACASHQAVRALDAVERAAFLGSSARAVLSDGQAASPTATVHPLAPVGTALRVVDADRILGVAEALDAPPPLTSEGAAVSCHHTWLAKPCTARSRDTEKRPCDAQLTPPRAALGARHTLKSKTEAGSIAVGVSIAIAVAAVHAGIGIELDDELAREEAQQRAYCHEATHD